MITSEKYGRTYHYPFSPGTTSDDRINHAYWQHIQQIPQLVHTEKLDGENTCLTRWGVYARSHAAPTTSPWTSSLRERWTHLKNDLGNLEVFLENCYAVHSLQYYHLPHHFHVFAIRDSAVWLGWEETKFYAALLDLPVVPEIVLEHTPPDREGFEKHILQMAGTSGAFCPHDVHTRQPANMEGVVTRNTAAYPVAAFAQNVFKYVRKDHVKTGEHWMRHWKRASLISEGGHHVENIGT